MRQIRISLSIAVDMETTFSYIGVYIESKTKQPWSYLKLAKIIFVAKIQQTLTKLTVLNLQYFKKDFLAPIST